MEGATLEAKGKAREEGGSSKKGRRSSAKGHMQMLSAHVALSRESLLRLADHVYDALAKTLQVSLLINVKNYLILKTLQAKNARCHVCNPCAQNFDSGSFARTCPDWRGDKSQGAGQGVQRGTRKGKSSHIY